MHGCVVRFPLILNNYRVGLICLVQRNQIHLLISWQLTVYYMYVAYSEPIQNPNAPLEI